MGPPVDAVAEGTLPVTGDTALGVEKKRLAAELEEKRAVIREIRVGAGNKFIRRMNGANQPDETAHAWGSEEEVYLIEVMVTDGGDSKQYDMPIVSRNLGGQEQIVMPTADGCAQVIDGVKVGLEMMGNPNAFEGAMLRTMSEKTIAGGEHFLTGGIGESQELSVTYGNHLPLDGYQHQVREAGNDKGQKNIDKHKKHVGMAKDQVKEKKQDPKHKYT